MTVKILILLCITSSVLAENLIGVEVYSGRPKYCVPPPPQNGKIYYTLSSGDVHPTVENAYNSFILTYQCIPAYLLWDMNLKTNTVKCKNGAWIYNIPDCHRRKRTEPAWPGPPRVDCVVPPHPRNGIYHVTNQQKAQPGDVFESVYLNVTCNYRFKTKGTDNVHCIKGQWSGGLPQCRQITTGCELLKHPTVIYNCKNDTNEHGLCNYEVPSGSTVELQCKPQFEDTSLWRVTTMKCVMGNWETVAVCTPNAGSSGCELFQHQSLDYRCSVDVSERICDDIEPAGSEVHIRCRLTGGRTAGTKTEHFFCRDTNWIHTTSCTQGKKISVTTTPIINAEKPEPLGLAIPSKNSVCVVPPHPSNGRYKVLDKPNTTPGDEFDSLYLTASCLYGFTSQGSQPAFCIRGLWSGKLPKCVRICQLPKHPSVDYICSIDSLTSRACNYEEPSGTKVQPQCKPYYMYSGVLKNMSCEDGNWNYVALCSPSAEQKYSECGIPSGNSPLIIGGDTAVRGEIPWHAGIYTKTDKPYSQICGGSLITNFIVISAAHCFWSDLEKLLPASLYAVAVGKLYRAWEDARDLDAQKSEVSDIIISPLFQGNAANYQDDIALVLVTTPFVYRSHVRPVCLDFDYDFEKKQLRKGNMGKVAGWGLTTENGSISEQLRITEMPYVTYTDCIQGTSPSFAAYITSDKICAGSRGTAVCRGDSGGGLVFPARWNGTTRHYLRGLVSTAPSSSSQCNAQSWATFTNVNRHQHLIRDYL